MDVYFLYCINPESEEPIMLLDRHIGFDEADGYGIMGDAFQRELLALDGMDKKRIQVWINCPGGNVVEGYNIYNAMLKTKTKVDTYCFGMAASMAAVIFQAGRKRIMADYSWLMYHNPYSTDGSGKSDCLETMGDSLAKMIASRSGKTEDEIRAIMRKTTYIMAEEALAEGLCDEIEHSADYNRKKAMPVEAKAFWKESNKVFNSLFPNTQTPLHNMSLKKVAAKLNLNAEASEDAVVTEIESVQNKAKEHETAIAAHLVTIQNKNSELEKAKADLKEAQDKVAEMEKKEEEEKAAKAKAKEEAKAKADAEEAAKAKNMIEGFVKEGRIANKAEAIAEWTENCKVLGLDKVKNMLESLPVNRKAAKISIDVTNSGGETPKYSFAGAMVNISNKQKETATY